MKLHASAAERNRYPIQDVLRRWLPPRGLVLEIAAGSGLHAAWFAPRFPHLTWQPTDTDPSALASIAAWRDEAGANNLNPPLSLDVRAPSWPVERADAVFCANMIHIAPWDCARGLIQGAGRILPPGGVLILYGPFRVGGRMAPSNQAFDESLRARDPAWGVRDLEAVGALAQAAGLDHLDIVTMPANNLSVVWRKRP